MSTSISLPGSYADVPFKEISISHVPSSSLSPTKVVVLKLNRPEKYNAVTETMLIEIEKAYDLFSKDDRVRAVVVTGAGKAFCVGADLDIGFSGLIGNKKDQKSMDEFRDRGGRVALAISNCPKPTIMAINGSAVGFGLTVSLPAAIRVASADAKIGLPFARRGLTMESCSSYFLPRLIGLSKAMHLAVTGSTYVASDPMVSMLFSKVLRTPEETVSYAVTMATDVAENTSLISTKLMRDMMIYGPLTAEETHVLDSKAFISVVGSKDNMEGMNSFLEKRKPKFNATMEKDAPRFWPWWTPFHTQPDKASEQKTFKL